LPGEANNKPPSPKGGGFKPGTWRIKPKQTHYDCLEINLFWTYVGGNWKVFDMAFFYLNYGFGTVSWQYKLAG
jgi:hypothetical protein